MLFQIHTRHPSYTTTAPTHLSISEHADLSHQVCSWLSNPHGRIFRPLGSSRLDGRFDIPRHLQRSWAISVETSGAFPPDAAIGFNALHGDFAAAVDGLVLAIEKSSVSGEGRRRQ